MHVHLKGGAFGSVAQVTGSVSHLICCVSYCNTKHWNADMVTKKKRAVHTKGGVFGSETRVTGSVSREAAAVPGPDEYTPIVVRSGTNACCSVLQRVAACCSVWQRVAACCGVLQRDAACCSVLQRVAACCSVLQRVAVCSSVMQCIAMSSLMTRCRITYYMSANPAIVH